MDSQVNNSQNNLLGLGQTQLILTAAPSGGSGGAGGNHSGNNNKCCYRSCKVVGTEKKKCVASNCDKYAHLMCFQGLLLSKHEFEALPDGNVACTKKCYKKAFKELVSGGEDEGGRTGKWDSDGLNGPDDPHTSTAILIEWWMEEGNYCKFCGKNNGGIKKIQFATMLAKKMTKETTSKHERCQECPE
jgi:hypothetical protein